MRSARNGTRSRMLNWFSVFLAFAVIAAVISACNRNSADGDTASLRPSLVGPDGDGVGASSIDDGGEFSCGESGSDDGEGTARAAGVEKASGADNPGGEAPCAEPSDDSGQDNDAGDGNNQTVSNQNPGGDPVELKDRSDALENATSIDVVRWTAEPVIRGGEAVLVASGVLEQNARLFDPVSGEGSAFSVYYTGHEEALVELVPDPDGDGYWDTLATIAPTEVERNGSAFTIHAYSPLFMDAGDTSRLHLRVWGYDDAGREALLSVVGIGAE